MTVLTAMAAGVLLRLAAVTVAAMVGVDVRACGWVGGFVVVVGRWSVVVVVDGVGVEAACFR